MFGKGFDESNLRRMRLFYKAFPIRDTLCHELSWSHYRSLIRIENPLVREWYLKETKQVERARERLTLSPSKETI